MDLSSKNVLFILLLVTNLLYVCNLNLKTENLKKVQTRTGTATVSLQKLKMTRDEKKKYRHERRHKQAFNSTIRILDTVYIVKMYVGNPPQEVLTTVDTGSSLLHYAVYECKVHKMCHTDLLYDPSKSKTFRNTSHNFDQYYGDGWLQSVFAYDDVSINGIVVHNQKIGMVRKQHHVLDRIGGIVGLAYPRKELPEGNLMENMIKQNILRQNVMGYYLSDKEGSMQFGYIDHSLIHGKFNKHKVIEERRWVLHVDDVLLNGKPLNLCKNTTCHGLVDTGTTDLSLPEYAYKILTDHLKIDKYCSGFDKLPVVTYVIDGKHYDMKPEEYIKSWKTRKSKTEKCFSYFYAFDLSKEDKVWLLGEPFIKKFYPVFDRDHNMIHLGLKK